MIMLTVDKIEIFGSIPRIHIWGTILFLFFYFIRLWYETCYPLIHFIGLWFLTVYDHCFLLWEEIIPHLLNSSPKNQYLNDYDVLDWRNL